MRRRGRACDATRTAVWLVTGLWSFPVLLSREAAKDVACDLEPAR